VVRFFLRLGIASSAHPLPPASAGLSVFLFSVRLMPGVRFPGILDRDAALRQQSFFAEPEAVVC